MIYDLLLKDGEVYIDGSLQKADIAIVKNKISKINPVNAKAKKILDLKGLTVLPGLLDTQVHFRDPGLVHKEDFYTGTKAALKGGITGIFDMPNTLPPTANVKEYNLKLARARANAFVNFGLYVGALKESLKDLKNLENLPACIGIKIFMGKSTGGLVLNDAPDLEYVLKNTKSNISLHCEDETLLNERFKEIPKNATSHYHPVWRNEQVAFKATERIVNIAKKLGRKVHILHVTTKEELEFLKKHKNTATVEILPQHLLMSHPEDYDRLGSLVQMNPPIRSKTHQKALWQALKDGTVSVVASDHAPHLLEEKQKPYPESPSGLPGVQTLLPLMLNFHNQGKITLKKVVDVMFENPVKIFGLKDMGMSSGCLANFSVVDLKGKFEITNKWIQSKCGYTPYDGMQVVGRPMTTILNGEVALLDGEIVGDPKGKEFLKQ